MGLWLPVVVLAAFSGAGACGVSEHPHEEAKVDTSNDFGPIDAAVTPKDVTTTHPPMRDAEMSGRDDQASPPDDPADAASPPPEEAAPPDDPNAKINLGGTVVLRKDAIAFIHLGHSNMSGRAKDPANLRPWFFTDKDPFAWMYHAGKPPEPALEPHTAGDGLDPGAGPGTALVKEAAALAPGKYFVSLGFGKSSAYCSQFLPGGLYYDLMMAAPKAIKGKVTFGAIVVMLGITERHGTAGDITGYPECINKLVTAIRTDLEEPNLPLLLTDYEVEATGEFAPDQSFPQKIIPEIRRVPGVVANSALVPADGIPMQDNHHFNLEGHKTWVARLLQIMQDKKWFPWAP